MNAVNTSYMVGQPTNPAVYEKQYQYVNIKANSSNFKARLQKDLVAIVELLQQFLQQFDTSKIQVRVTDLYKQVDGYQVVAAIRIAYDSTHLLHNTLDNLKSNLNGVVDDNIISLGVHTFTEPRSLIKYYDFTIVLELADTTTANVWEDYQDW